MFKNWDWGWEAAVAVGTTVAAVLAWVFSRFLYLHETRATAHEADRKAVAANRRLDEMGKELVGVQVTLGKLETRLEALPATVAASVLDKLGAAGLIDRRK